MAHKEAIVSQCTFSSSACRKWGKTWKPQSWNQTRNTQSKLDLQNLKQEANFKLRGLVWAAVAIMISRCTAATVDMRRLRTFKIKIQPVDESVIYSFDPLFSVFVPSIITNNTSPIVVKYFPYTLLTYNSTLWQENFVLILYYSFVFLKWILSVQCSKKQC